MKLITLLLHSPLISRISTMSLPSPTTTRMPSLILFSPSQRPLRRIMSIPSSRNTSSWWMKMKMYSFLFLLDLN